MISKELLAYSIIQALLEEAEKTLSFYADDRNWDTSNSSGEQIIFRAGPGAAFKTLQLISKTNMENLLTVLHRKLEATDGPTTDDQGPKAPGS